MTKSMHFRFWDYILVCLQAGNYETRMRQSLVLVDVDVPLVALSDGVHSKVCRFRAFCAVVSLTNVATLMLW